ncbi:N-6 DNA methylase [Salmonirosea aquatica]|uniref:N-6 DNA methylase n=1 Tax=Salmonirosea aquatica TaxID=2654236 RepID=A0A7C9BWA7_9BACT|nr:N-6 DNA methylase [Cytophagaceae bacterium SJW1-29]
MNKIEQMRLNLTALRLAFEIHLSFRNANPQENMVLSQYAGFGGLSEILIDPKNDTLWTDSNKRMRPSVEELHDLVELYRPNDFSRYLQSARNSVLTGFYTPAPIIEALSSSLKAVGISLNSVLDPSAGNGRFIEVIRAEHRPNDVLMYEKDLLTGLLLSARSSDTIKIEGFENIGGQKANRFDLVTSNIPFGKISIYDPTFSKKGPVENQSTAKIHNYFFLKSIDLARPGGLVALLTTDSFANTESNRVFRENLLQKARLISAVRLPSTLFKKAGTEAGSDFIIVQKRAKPVTLLSAQENLFLETSNPLPDTEAVKSNRYFDSAPNKIIHTSREVGTNQYGKLALIYNHSGDVEQIGREIFRVFQQDLLNFFDHRLYQAKPLTNSKRKTLPSGQLDLFSTSSVAPLAQPTAIEFTGDRYEHLTHGSIFQQAGTVGALRIDDSGKTVLEPMRLSTSQKLRWEMLIDIRDSYFKLVHQERDNQTESPQLREQLNVSYDLFKSSFGSLKDRTNIDTILIDPSGRQLLALETFNEQVKTYEKTDIFHRPVHVAHAHVSTFTPQESLVASLNRFGTVDLGYMSEISGETSDRLLAELNEQVFYNPLDGGYQIKDVLGSGNIQLKIDRIKGLAPTDAVGALETDRTLRYLESVCPEPVPFELIDFNLGERWLDTALYSRFASSFFSTEVAVSYASAIDDFGVKGFDHRYNPKLTEEYAVHSNSRTYTGLDLLRYALLDNVPDITKKMEDGQGREITVRDSEKIRLASQKIDTIRNGFVDWMRGLPLSEKKEIEETYNRLYNSEVKQKFDGSHLKFPHLRLQNLGIKDLYGSQKDTAWMLIQNAGGIVDHEVGTGKTLTMIVTAYEMKRLGLVAKPMIVGMKANVVAIAETFKAAYPDARILAPSEQDFSRPRRERLFDSMANTAWDCIILTHDQFAKIPQSLDVQRRLISSEVANLDKDLNELSRTDYRVGTALLKGLERRKVSLTNNLNSVLHQIEQKKDNILDFEKMGIDFLQVDESHKFKNLLFTTRHDRVAGLGNQVGSQRALNMLFAVRTIQEKRGGDSGVAFYSGTPISNSLTELYLLFKYLRPKELERQKMENFDSWSSWQSMPRRPRIMNTPLRIS